MKEKEKEKEEKVVLTKQEKKDMMKKAKKKNGMTMTAIGPKNKIGTMPIGAQKNCTTRMTVDVPEKRKRQERKEKKEERTMKEKASQSICGHPLHRNQPIPNQPQQVHCSSSMS